MLVDIAICLVAIFSVVHGRDIGFVRNFFSATGFFIGVILGAWLQGQVISDPISTTAQALLVVVSSLGLGLILLTVGEYIGIHFKHSKFVSRHKKIDKYLGSIFSLVVLVICIWLLSALSLSLPYSGLQDQMDESFIVRNVNEILPSAPIVIDHFSSKITRTNGTTSSSRYPQAKDSVYKIISQGCGQLKVGTGFNVGNNLVATNAHVVAGIKNPHIQTSNKILRSEVVYIDPDLDFALLKTSSLNGTKLKLDSKILSEGSPVELFGYSEGGPLQSKPGHVNGHFLTKTNNIFADKKVKRDIYEITTPIKSGDSGGPVLSGNGVVSGMAFAESTSMKDTGYSLMSKSISPIIDIANAKDISQPVLNNSCPS